MSWIIADQFGIDCPNPKELSAFYAGFLGLEDGGYFVKPRNGTLTLWFQEAPDYQPPTWPTQERGQQAHFDFASSDHDANIAKAVALGATLTERRDGYHYPILLDPVGHPFCLITPNQPFNELDLWAINIDCDDVPALTGFYQQLYGGEIEHNDGFSDLVRDDSIKLSFQHAADYRAPTWPTQERGQQVHIDFKTDDRAGFVARAIELGAKLMDESGEDWTVLLDPAGHPFCICDPDS